MCRDEEGSVKEGGGGGGGGLAGVQGAEGHQRKVVFGGETSKERFLLSVNSFRKSGRSSVLYVFFTL